MNQEKIVYIVVLAWNHKEDTRECLQSMLKSDYQNLHYLLVDNASTDGTFDMMKEDFSQVEVIHSETNLGVSGGYNLGMEYALRQGADYVLIANNDIVVSSSMVSELVKELESSQAGIGMPKIYHYYGDRTRLWTTGARWRRIPPSVKMVGVNAKDTPKFSKPYDIQYAPSCCLLITREVLENVGFFDTGYFFYNDDWDYCIRCRKAGYSIRFVPSAKMWHKVSVSTQKTEKPAKWWNYYGRSTQRFYTRYARPYQLSMFIVWFIIRESLKGKVKRIMPFLEGIKTESAKLHQKLL